MDEINKIKKLYLDGTNKHELARRFNRSWATISKIVEATREDLSNRGKRPNRKPSVITAEVIEAIDNYFKEEESKKVRRKQRYTAKAIYKRLKEAGIYSGSLRRIQDVVKEQRKKYNQTKEQSYLPLEFALGTVVQVDHGEADLEVAGTRYKGYIFTASVPGHVLRFCQWFPTKASESWGEFHERMFQFFEGIFPEVIYDNDSVLVSKVLGRERNQTTFSLNLEEHYGFTSKFCNVASGNEKGAVENAVGYCRRNYLPGYPKFSDWDAVNSFLKESCLKEIKEEKHYKNEKNLQSIFDKMQPDLIPLLPKRKWGKQRHSRVNSYQLITIDKKEYSVPERYVGTSVDVFTTIFDVQIFKDNQLIAVYDRMYTETSALKLEHYLDQLEYKPAALWDCKAVKSHKFDPKLLEMWERLSKKHSKGEANREFVRILKLGRKYGQKSLIEAVELSLLYNGINSAAVENIIRQTNTKQPSFDTEQMKAALPELEINSWSFDLSAYRELCVGVQ